MTLTDFATTAEPETCPDCAGLADGDLCFEHYVEAGGDA